MKCNRKTSSTKQVLRGPMDLYEDKYVTYYGISVTLHPKVMLVRE